MRTFTELSERPGLVLFAEDFDAELRGAPAPEPETIEPVITVADLEAARQQAWQNGYDDATAAAARSTQTATRDSLGAIAAALGDARQRATEIAEQAAEELARLLLDCMATALPDLCVQHGDAELRAMVRTLLPALLQEQTVTIRLNPANAAAVTREFESLGPDPGTCMQVIATESLAPGDMRVSWRGGQAARDATALWAQIAEILAPAGLLSCAPRKEAEHVG
jgi:flagellar biosynthesis/type III secretory pathway protein FliH